jgi:NAD(P)H-flavin reductase
VSAAPFGRRALTVASVEQVGAYHLLELADPDGPEPRAGQFAMLACTEEWGGGQDERPFLPRAISIARHRGGRAQFLLEAVGPGSARLCAVKEGESVWALGPLGNGFTAPAEGRSPILVGGGVGIAPLMILQDQLAGACTVLLGFRGSNHAAGAGLLTGAQVATDDGSAGHHGTVTEMLERELAGDRKAEVYACGPAGMLESVRALCERSGTPVQLALEAPMACGFGACYGCVVPRRGGGYLRVCVEGPVISGSELAAVDEHAGAPA